MFVRRYCVVFGGRPPRAGFLHGNPLILPRKLRSVYISRFIRDVNAPSATIERLFSLKRLRRSEYPPGVLILI